MSTNPGYRKINGVCAQTDPEAFYPEKGGSTREAKKVCFGCDDRRGCIRTALDAEESFGIWGGLSERDRRVLLPHWRNVGADAQQALVELLLNVRTFAGLVAFLKTYRLANEAAARARKKAAAKESAGAVDENLGGDLADAA